MNSGPINMSTRSLALKYFTKIYFNIKNKYHIKEIPKFSADIGTSGESLQSDGRTGKHIEYPSDLQCDSAFGNCRWGNGKETDEDFSWMKQNAKNIDDAKWANFVGAGTKKPGLGGC